MRATAATGAADAGLLRRLLGRVPGALWLGTALVAGWLLWPTSLGGCTTLTIVSGESMEPTYSTGDLVVSRCGEPEVGDVVVYTPPGIEGARVIHRVVGENDEGWVLQGDNNGFLDPWNPTSQDVLGSAVLHVPHLGRVAVILLSPMTWVSVLVLAVAVVVWPSGGRPDDAGADDAPSDDVPSDDGVAARDAAPV